MILVTPEHFIGQYALAQSVADADTLLSYINREEKKTLYKLLGKELSDLLIAYIAFRTPITEGLLIVDQKYVITEYVAGDDFTNVGAASNASGVSFTATGTVPTDYSNGSTLTPYTDRYENLINPFYDDSENSGFTYEPGCRPHIHESTGILDLLLIQIYYCYLSEEQIIHSQSGLVGASAENSAVQSPRQAYRKGEQKWNEAGLTTWDAIRWYCLNYSTIYPEYKGIKESTRYSSII